MARLASQQIAGYYPVPTELLPAIASTVKIDPATGSRDPSLRKGLALFDPCAGDGEALMTLADLWDARFTVGVELEFSRYLEMVYREPSRSQQADAFQLAWTERDQVDLLWLNPPYDHDPDFGRLEQRFLHYLAPALRPSGVLLFLIPITALAASAEYLGTRFENVRAWRLPEPHYERFRQILVVGQWRREPVDAIEPVEAIRAWSDDPESIPVLGTEGVDDPVVYHFAYRHTRKGPFEPTVLPLPVDTIEREFESFHPVPDGQSAPLADLLDPKFPTAAPPRPAHVALALTEGVFDGKRLVPDDPTRHPEILASGKFAKALRAIGTTRNEDGKVTGIKKMERPNLQITVLDLSTYEFHDLVMGADPSESTNLDEWTAGDLLKHYHRSLMGHLEQAFPILHDRRKPEHRLELPALERTPYPYQHEAIATALKLLAEGESDPIFQAEVGTGKSTMSLVLAASLAPGNRERIVEQLLDQGHDGAHDLPKVRKPLIVCPPHLVHSWRDEIRAVHGDDYPVFELETLSDIDRAAEHRGEAILIMARERAKLGHYWTPIGPATNLDLDKIPEKLAKRARQRGLYACSGCGARIHDKPQDLAKKRQRCGRTSRRPANAWARMLREMAYLIIVERPSAEVVWRALDPATRAHLVPKPDINPQAHGYSLPLVERLVEIAKRHYDHLGQGSRDVLGKFFYTVGGVHESTSPVDKGLAMDRPVREMLKAALDLAQWESRQCDEPLYAAVAKPLRNAPDQPFRGSKRFKPPKGPRSYPLSRYLAQRHPGLVDLVFLDEAHEYANKGSAQSQAAQRLSDLGVPTILLTGSLMNGYASSLFTLYWMTSAPFREDFGRSELKRFVRRFGFLEIWEPVVDASRGARTDRRVTGTRTKEAPGIHPSFVLGHLLRGSVILHKSDVEDSLPPLAELAEPIGFDADYDPHDELLRKEYQRLEMTLIDEVRKSGPNSGMSPLLGALAQLPSFLDRATEDQGPYEVRYPQTEDGKPGTLVFRSKPLPESYVTPKERYLLATLKAHLAADLPTMVFLQNTGTPDLPNRLVRLVRENVTDRVAFLDAKAVPTSKRQQWIIDHVNKPEKMVLFVNPKAVSTGLNCLTRFCRAIWFQLGYETRTYRQANGRAHRIGQKRPVEILVPYYAGTAQAAQFQLMSAKLETALQVDGLDIRGALEAAGAGSDDRVAAASTMSLGEALYEAMTTTTDADPMRHFRRAPELDLELELVIEPEPVQADAKKIDTKKVEAGQLTLEALVGDAKPVTKKPAKKRSILVRPSKAPKIERGQQLLFAL